jgi:hypothetical protein
MKSNGKLLKPCADGSSLLALFEDAVCPVFPSTAVRAQGFV